MWLLLLLACANEVSYAPASRAVDAWPYVDAGVIAVGDRQVFTVPLFSNGNGPVTVFAIETEDLSAPGDATEPAFRIDRASWAAAGCDQDGDGTDDCTELARYTDASDEDTLALPVVFAPTALGAYEALLTVWSNDTESTVDEPLPDEPDTSWPVWRVQLRGRAGVPCGRVWPRFVDLGPRPAGGEFRESVRIDNCGPVPLVVSAIQVGDTSVSSTTTFPIYVLPGLSEEVSLSWSVPAPSGDGPTAVAALVSFVSNATDLASETVTVYGNRCEGSLHPDWDADGDGWYACAGDCDDADRTIGPNQVERAGTGEDEDCDGEIDEAPNPVAVDDDGDGWTELAGDCDDADPSTAPGATEIADAVDQDCDGDVDDGTEWFDDDGDGWTERDGDCDDAQRFASPDRDETIDGIDNDCDARVDEGGIVVDDDGDGLTDAAGDCDDGDAWVIPGGTEFCDGYDNDCDNAVDEAEDEACAFLPERREDEAPASEDPAGCAATGPRDGGTSTPLASLALLVLAAVVRRGGAPK